MDSNSLPYILIALALLGVSGWNLWLSVWVNPDAQRQVEELLDSPRQTRAAFLHHVIVQTRIARATHLTLVLILMLLTILALR